MSPFPGGPRTLHPPQPWVMSQSRVTRADTPPPKKKKTKKGCQGAVLHCQGDLGGRRRRHREADAIGVVTVPRGSGGRRHRGEPYK